MFSKFGLVVHFDVREHDGLARGGECAEYVSGLELPENLEEFWTEWLKVIGS